MRDRHLRLVLVLGFAGAWLAGPALLAQSGQAAFLAEALQLMERGDYEEAERRLDSDSDPHVLRLRLELADRTGRRAESEALARRLLALQQAGRLGNSAALGEAAFAAWHLQRWRDANQLFIEASRLNPVAVSVYVDWGNLYLEKYNPGEAESIFADALKDAVTEPYSRWGPDAAYVGLARALRALGKPGSKEAAEQARSLNPDSLELQVDDVRSAILEDGWDDARRLLDRGLEVNRNYLPLLELECVFLYFQEEAQDFEKALDRVLGINPRNSRLFERLGDMSVSKRRLEQAVEFFRRAIELDERNWQAVAALGINLLRLGEEEEGLLTLERAYANDPFNIWTVNTLRLLDSFKDFEVFETSAFRVRLHQKEAAALRPYVEELLERSLRSFEEIYGHKISGRYTFEMYPDHDDFAVRTLGLPGLGALGATFGRIVAMDSPSGRPRGRFHWGSTLWHEMAHVVTLSLSDYKLPRWFAEGIAMMEERRAEAGWGETLTPAFVRAYRDGQLLPLEDLNSGFLNPTSPLQIELSYFQAGWVCDFLAERHGFQSIRDLSVAFAEDKTAEEAFQKVLGKSIEEIDREFQAEMARTLDPLVPRLETAPWRGSLPVGEEEPGSAPALDAVLVALMSHPDSYYLNLEAGRQLWKQGRGDEAVKHLEKALELFPALAGKDSPYDLLTQIHLESGRTDQAIEILGRWWKTSPLLAENALKLAELLAERNQVTEATKYLEKAMYVDPLDPRLHLTLGDLYLRGDEPRKAVREFEVLLSLNPVDLAGARYRLAEALFQSGDREAARRQVLLALEIAPHYAEAQKLLLKLVRP